MRKSVDLHRAPDTNLSREEYECNLFFSGDVFYAQIRPEILGPAGGSTCYADSWKYFHCKCKIHLGMKNLGMSF